jgi:glycosyltransferase involved in cell wall biosynthesis
MRVLLLTQVFPRAADDPFGAFLLHLLSALGDRVDPCVVAPHAPGLPLQETIAGVPVRRFTYAPEANETLAYTGVMHEQVRAGTRAKIVFASFMTAYVNAAVAAAREHRADVIHAHWWVPGGLAGAAASRLVGIPLIVTTHGTDVEQLRRSRWARPLAQLAFRRAFAVTAGSTYLRDQLLGLGAVPPARVSVIPMPVNPLFESGPLDAARDELPPVDLGGLPPDDRRPSTPLHILGVSRLTAQKRLDTLIDALGILRSRGIDAHLRIAGDGDRRPSLEQQAHALGLAPSVEFLGLRPQVELVSLYRECDIFVLPSVDEGLGLVLAEALLCGAPLVAARSGGIPDIVRDGETGLLFPPGDPAALAAALERLARDPTLARELAARGRVHVLEHFTSARIAESFLSLYRAARSPHVPA